MKETFERVADLILGNSQIIGIVFSEQRISKMGIGILFFCFVNYVNRDLYSALTAY